MSLTREIICVICCVGGGKSYDGKCMSVVVSHRTSMRGTFSVTAQSSVL